MEDQRAEAQAPVLSGSQKGDWAPVRRKERSRNAKEDGISGRQKTLLLFTHDPMTKLFSAPF